MQKPKNIILELVLCIALGWAGGHKFYNKKIGMGILYLLTYGLFGIGWLIDTIILIVNLIKEKKTLEIPSPASSSPTVSAPTVIDTTPSEVPMVADRKSKTYKVTAMQHYMSNIMKLASENFNYDNNKQDLIDRGLTNERVWKYEFHPSSVKLVPEPTNPHDKNAIMVLVDGEHVGYIKAGSCAHLLKVINEGRIADIKCTMGGGPYKYVDEEYDYEKDKTVYTMDHSTCPHFVHLEISEKDPIA